VDFDVNEPAAIRRREWRGPRTATGFAVLALPFCQHDPIVAVGAEPDDLEPSIGVRDE
jgi:hypothetical protein